MINAFVWETFRKRFDHHATDDVIPGSRVTSYIWSEAEFKEFKSRLKSTKTQFKLSTGLNLETFDTILSETNHN